MRGSRACKPGVLVRCLIACCALGATLPAASASAAELPDGRIFEQVTPEEKYGSEVYLPEKLIEVYEGVTKDTTTTYTFQAAADGAGIAYVAAPMLEGNESEGYQIGNEFVAKRSAPDAWSVKDLSPEAAPSAIFQELSPNLTTGFLDSAEALSPLAPGFGEPEEIAGEGSYDVLYSVSTAEGGYAPLFVTKPPYRSMTRFGTAFGTSRRPFGEINSHRASRVFGYLSFEGASANDTHLLFAANDALTAASEGRPAAEGGAGATFEKENNLYESVDGQLRLVNVLPDGTRTVEVSPEGTYQTASADGSIAFFTNGSLYSYEVGGHTTDLTPGVSVEKVLGASEDGKYVYYLTVSKEVVLWHEGSTSPVTSLAAGASLERFEVAPDGRSITFQVSESKATQQRVYVYDSEGEALFCASCTSVAAAAGEAEDAILPMTNFENVYQPRWMSADGAHVFFDALDGLVVQDTNGVDDVYEWKRSGTGGCKESTGCVYLLSGGTSTDYSLLLDASESGQDVFITTRADLLASDEDGLYDVYDVRVGDHAPVPPACTGTGCQGVPPAPPAFATPPTVTFSGLGDLTPRTVKARSRTQGKHKAKARRAHELRQALRRCAKRHRGNAQGRRACRRRARHRYGARAARAGHGTRVTRHRRGGGGGN